MDRRLSGRSQFQQQVILESPQIGRITATAYNISLGGMAAETDTVPLPTGANVFVTFDLPYGERQERFRIEAVVTRYTETSTGLMFVRMTLEVIRRLSEVLSQLQANKNSSRPPLTTGYKG